jgi:hypothetical protein
MVARRTRTSRCTLPPLAILLIAAGALSACQVDVVDVPDQIPSDCSGNVSAQLNTWLANLQDGTVVRLNGGCYRIDQTLELTDHHNIDIDGGGALFQTSDPTGDASTLDTPSRAARTRSQLRIVRGSNIRIHDLAIRGANPNAGTGVDAYVPELEAQHGIEVQGTQGVELFDLSITDVYGDFVSFSLSDSTWSTGHLHDSTMARNGRQGISLTGAHDVTIDDNVITDTRRATFDLEPNGGAYGVDSVTITGNTIGAGRLLFIAAGGSGPVDNISIVDNVLQGRSTQIYVDGAGADRRHNWWISGNHSDQPWGSPAPSAPITLHDVDGVVIANNHQPLQAGRGDAGVDVTGSTEITVRGNSFNNAFSVLEVPDDDADVCGNQIVVGDDYDQPIPCPAAAQANRAPAPAIAQSRPSPTSTTAPASSTTTSTIPAALQPGPVTTERGSLSR